MLCSDCALRSHGWHMDAPTVPLWPKLSLTQWIWKPPPRSLTFISIFHTQLSLHTQIKAWLYLTCDLKHTEFMGKTSVSEWESVTFSGFHTGNILVYNVCSSSNSWKRTKRKLETTNVILLYAANLEVQHTLQAAVVKLAWQQSSNGAMKQSRFLWPGMCSVCCGHNQEN